jgi:hypothetical protein
MERKGSFRRSRAARLLGLWVRIPPGACMSVSCEFCVSGRGLCVGLVTRPEKSYRVWCVWVWSWCLENWGGLGPQGAVEPLEKKGCVPTEDILSDLIHLSYISGRSSTNRGRLGTRKHANVYFRWHITPSNGVGRSYSNLRPPVTVGVACFYTGSIFTLINTMWYFAAMKASAYRVLKCSQRHQCRIFLL